MTVDPDFEHLIRNHLKLRHLAVLDPYRNSGELPFRLTSHTFKLHGADAAQV